MEKLSLEQVYDACHRFIWHKDSRVRIVHTPTERRYIISNSNGWQCGLLYICIPHYTGKSPQNQTGQILFYCQYGYNEPAPRWIATTHHKIAHAMDKSASKLTRLLGRYREPEFCNLVANADKRPLYKQGYPYLGTESLYNIIEDFYQKQK